MANIDFNAILNKKANEVEAPVALPVGSYLLTVVAYSFGTSQKQQAPFVKFEFQPVSAGEDVDQEALAKVKNLNERKVNATFYITEESLFRIKDFLGKCGLDVEGESTLSELIPTSIGCQVIGIMKAELANDNSGREFIRLNSFVKA